jgi:radical SAM protein with 4Fe4S-binding SPASM domain
MKQIAFDYDLVNPMVTPVKKRIAKLMRLKRYANEADIEFYGTWETAFINLLNGSILEGPRFCCAAVEGRSLEFDVDGSVRTCSHGKVAIGQVDKFNKLFSEEGGLYKLAKERFPGSDPGCQGCEIEGLCAGQCHVSRESAGVIPGESPQFQDLCDFYRQITHVLIMEHLRNNNQSN